VEGVPGWLQQLAAVRPFLLAAGAAVVLSALLRLAVAASPAGRRLRHAVHAAEGGLLALLLAAMIGLSFLQVLLRNLADTGYLWIEPLLRHLVLWVGLLGAMLASRSGRHINVDALSRLLRPPVLRAARAATNLLAASVCLLLAHACLKLVRDELEVARVAFLTVPTWALQSVMPVAALVMSSRFLGHALEALRGRGAGVQPSHPEVAA
jgi:TRAP-type C4-dicarboxylate transport system permease small subunit